MKAKIFSESDFKNLELSECDKSVINDFLKSINSETIGKIVLNALDQRKQGHFNDAVLSMTEANRDQVLAIRETQTILDKLEGRSKTTVILEKFRQTFPFQLGLTDGGQVLKLLDEIKSLFKKELPQMIVELNNNEKELDVLTEEYVFFENRMADKISKNELDMLKEKINHLTEKINSTKKLILNNIINFITEKFSSISPNDKIRLVSCLYLILTSCIETLDAKLVKV